MFGVILAGGSGSRLWPLSRELYPKQLLHLYSDKSLVQSTFERLTNFIPAQEIICVTNKSSYQQIKMQLDEISTEAVIISEECSKNTAPAISFALDYIEKQTDDDEIILVVPSDLLINDNKSFEQSIKRGIEFAKSGKIVTFGVKPTYAETGFGYILSENNNVSKFIEKPDEKTASELIKNPNYYWNSGIFMFKLSTIKNEMKKYCPEILDTDNFEQLPYISIDYALIEQTKNLAMVELTSDWKDLGAWNFVYDVSPKDKNNNVFVGHVLDIESKNSFVYSSSKLVATVGLEDMVVVETEDAILACKKNKAQEVKQVYETLRKQHDGTQKIHKTVHRPWGFYTIIAQGKGFITKIIHVNPGQKLSVQSHNYRSEHWVVLTGTAKVVLEGKDNILSPGHSIDIAVKEIHSLQNPFDEHLEIIEVQKGDILEEDDIIRYEDMYGRC